MVLSIQPIEGEANVLLKGMHNHCAMVFMCGLFIFVTLEFMKSMESKLLFC